MPSTSGGAGALPPGSANSAVAIRPECNNHTEMAESSSEDQFRVLQREIRDAIRRNHPNPGRVGCVGSEKLSAMARGSLPTDDPAYNHVMECSPCYEELMALTEQVETAKRTAAPNRKRF